MSEKDSSEFKYLVNVLKTQLEGFEKAYEAITVLRMPYLTLAYKNVVGVYTQLIEDAERLLKEKKKNE